MDAFSLFYLVCSIFNILLKFKGKTRADVASVYFEIMSLEDFDFTELSVSKLVLDGDIGS